MKGSEAAGREAAGSEAARAIRRWQQVQLVVVLLLAVLGCSSAFGRAMDQGDASAALGEWDAAAAAYEQAVRLDPDDADALAKLAGARRAQAAVRVHRAEVLLSRGGHREALAPLAEAVRLDPQNLRARALFASVSTFLLDEAEKELLAGRGRAALALTGEVLARDPDNLRARELDGRVREAIATLAYDRGIALVDAGQPASALLQFAAAAEVRPGFRDAELRLAPLRAEVRRRATFDAVMAPLSADPELAVVVGDVTPAMVQGELPARIPLRVSFDLAPDAAAGGEGLRFGAHLEGYRFDARETSSLRHCTYVCERTMVPNPEHARAEREADAALSALSPADQDVSRAQADHHRRAQALRGAERALERARRAVERSEERLSTCTSAPPSSDGAPADCAPERREVDEARKELDQKERDVVEPRDAERRAQAELSTARERRADRMREIERANARLRDTPSLVEHLRHCDHSYRVQHHEVEGRMVVRLSARRLHDEGVVFEDEELPVSHRSLDDSFEAEPGRCAEIEDGDPRRIPGEHEVQRDLARRAARVLAQRVLAAYEATRQRTLGVAQQAGAEGRFAEALEMTARYLVTSPARDPLSAEREAVLELARLSQTPPTAAARLFR